MAGGHSVEGRCVGRAGCVAVVRRIEIAWGFAISRWSMRDWGFLKVRDTPAMSMWVPSSVGLLWRKIGGWSLGLPVTLSVLFSSAVCGQCG
jgi:hypothetical protein